MERLSVVVPVYNAARYLEECIESILAQTYQNIEIILVNDGSADGSGEICGRYAKQYENVVYVSQENRGAAQARKTGIAHAGGNYVTFVDGDDTVEPHVYEAVFGRMLEAGADVATFAMRQDDGQLIKDRVPEGLYEGERKQELCRGMIFDDSIGTSKITCSVCTKIYRKAAIAKAIQEIDPDVRLWEDVHYVYLPFVREEKILITHCVGYFYRQHAESVTHKADPDELRKVNDSFRKAKERYASCPADVKNSLYFLHARALSDIIWRTCGESRAGSRSREEIRQALCRIAGDDEFRAAVRAAFEKNMQMPKRDRVMLRYMAEGAVDKAFLHYRKSTAPRYVRKKIGRTVRRVLRWNR